MTTTRWNEAELAEFFGAVAEFSEQCESYSFTRSARGIRLSLTLFHLEGAVYVSLSRAEDQEALVTLRRERCSHARIVRAPSGSVCLGIGSPADQVSEMDVPPVLVRGIRVVLDPDIRLEIMDQDEKA